LSGTFLISDISQFFIQIDADHYDYRASALPKQSIVRRVRQHATGTWKAAGLMVL
jgi:hypothetical protein